jgi:hypothetical protein
MEYLIIPWLFVVAATLTHPVLISLAWAIPFVATWEMGHRKIISLWWARGIAIGALAYAIFFVAGYVILSEAMKGLH